MLAIEGKRLIADYLAWLKEGFHTEESPDHVVISTPFLDPHNDEVQIFVERKGDNLRLSDDGYTMADLSDMGLDVNTDKRGAHVRQILNGFGVHLDKSGELAVTATPRDFPQKKHNLMQAMLAMHDLAVMGQSHVAQFFEEDVAAYLRERGVSFFRNLKLSGRSGFDHHFDFGFSATNRRPESIMQAVNSLSRELATSVAFAVNDVRLQRGADAIQAYAIVNDRDVKPALDYIDALKAYGISVHTWSNREALLPAFGQN